MPRLTESYIARLGEHLSFDDGLKRRVCEEIEAHLADAMADDPDGPSEVAEKRILARFGNAREIAREFAETALMRRLRLVCVSAFSAIVAVFIAMRLRNAVFLQQHDIGSAFDIALFVDRYAFTAAIAACTIGWLFMYGLRESAQAGRAIKPLAIGAAALTVSTTAGVFAFCTTVAAVGWTNVALAVVFTIACEIAILGVLSVNLRTLSRHMAFVAQ